MADQSDVEAALAALVGGALYSDGIGRPGAASGAICRIYRGWPTPAALDADLAAGRVNVSVAAVAGSARVTTRYPDQWQALGTVTPTLAATVAGGVATFSGSAAPGQLAALLIDGRAAVHRTASGDTPASVAAALAGELQRLAAPPWSTATASGASVSLVGARSVVARVTADQPSLRETRRQQQNFAVTCWCADPATRDAVGGALDSALSGIDFIGLADGSSGRLRFVASVANDRWEDAVLYRRELTYSVDYATTIAATLPRLIVGGTQISPDGQGPIANLLG